jgi:hypothetical protein
MNNTERRTFMKGVGVGAFAFAMGGTEMLLTPRQARAQGMPLRTLTATEGKTLDAIGETLVPGAKEAGITNFVDQQISIPADEALLQARILNVRPPFANFYRAALGAIDGASNKTKGHKFAELSQQERHKGFTLSNIAELRFEACHPPAPFRGAGRVGLLIQFFRGILQLLLLKTHHIRHRCPTDPLISPPCGGETRSGREERPPS